MDLADGKLAYQKTKPFITTRGVKPLTHPKEVFSVFVTQRYLEPFEPFKPFKPFKPNQNTTGIQ